MLTRRTLLAGAAGAALASRAGSASTGGERLDVLVIGAGLSGLYSARLLEELGARVQVVEARTRVGGRLYTRYDLPGHPEVGGNTIASGYGRTIDLARRLDVELVDYAPRLFSGPAPALVIQGELVAPGQWPDSRHNRLPAAYRHLMPWEIESRRLTGPNPLAAAVDWLKPTHAGLDMPLFDYFQQQGLTEEEISLAWDTNPYFGDSSHTVSALMYLFNKRWIGEQRAIGQAAYAVAGGNQRLPEAMAGSLGREVRLGHAVMAIESERDRVRVLFSDRAPIEAAQVICSLPVSKLRDVSLQPGLAGPQLQALRSLRYMRNTLVFLVPKKPYWESDGMPPAMWTDGLLGTVAAQRFGDDPQEVTGLVVNARGWTADYLDRLGGEAAGRAVIAEIERLRPAAKGALEYGGWHSWWLDPAAAGDWAIYGPGQMSALAPHVTESRGRLHFCGEHGGLANRGMEAALESAERAVLSAAAML